VAAAAKVVKSVGEALAATGLLQLPVQRAA
jgi:hypothetical protein